MCMRMGNMRTGMAAGSEIRTALIVMLCDVEVI